MKKITTSLLVLSAIGLFSYHLISPAKAEGSYNFASSSGLNAASNQAGYETGASAKTPENYISQIITLILSLLGVIFLGFTIYGGLMWMTAQGNEEKVTKAKDLLTEAIIGVIIVLAAYAISYFVFKATSGSLLS